MIPESIRFALWELMEAIEEAKGLGGDDAEQVANLYRACNTMGDYILREQRKQKGE